MMKRKAKVILHSFSEEKPLQEAAPVLTHQTALLQCPQCGGWFLDDADRDGEACPECFEEFHPTKQGCGLPNV